VLLAMIAVGCPAPAKNKGQTCSSNRPCPAGQTCLSVTGATAVTSSTGVCVLATDPSQDQLYLEFRDEAQKYPPLQISVTLSVGQNQSFVLRTPLPVSGTITFPGNPLTPNLTPVAGADVRLTAHTGIPGHLVQVDAFADSSGGYSLFLPLGSYSVEVIPPAAALPGVVMPPIYLGDTSTDIITLPLSFTLPQPSALPRVTGTVMLADGSPIPAGGMLVTATDAALVDNLPGQIPPSLATPLLTTDGTFSVLLSPKGTPTPDEAQLHFAASPNAAPFPSFDSNVQPLDLSMVYPGGGVLSPVIMPLDVYAEPVQVMGFVEDSSGNPVTSAHILFLTQPGKDGLQPPFNYQAAATSDVNAGAFTVSLFQAWDTSVNYSVLAAPNLGARDVSMESPGLCSPVGGFPVVESREADLSATTGVVPPTKEITVNLRCASRVGVNGQVIDADGNPVAGAFVEATFQPTSDFPSELEFETTADGSGAFSLGVPAGVYTFTLTPPPQDNLPVTVLTGISVSKSTSLTLPVSKPFNLFGQIFIGDTRTPFSGVVTAYASNGTTSIQVASGAVGPEGRYSIIVPDLGR
jgi:hypothetical protein